MESNVLKGGCTYVTLTPPERYTCKQGEGVERDRWGETGGRRRGGRGGRESCWSERGGEGGGGGGAGEEGKREKERGDNSKTLFYKECSLGRAKTCLTTSLC